MDTIKIAEDINRHRRRFLGAAAVTVAAAQLGMIGSAAAQAGKTGAHALPAIKPGTNTSFGPLKQIDAGVLNVGYAEAGPADGPAVILLHGWPYDIHTYVDVAPLLASAGYRVIIPYLRGYGTTRFLSSETPRNGQQSVVAVDAIALMDALKIEKATVAGCRLGRADGQHHGGALARALQGHGVRERLSDRQPGSRQDAVAADRPSCSGGTNTISPPSAAAPATTSTGATSRSSSGRSLRRSGTSTTPRSIAAQRPSTTRIMSPS